MDIVMRILAFAMMMMCMFGMPQDAVAQVSADYGGGPVRADYDWFMLETPTGEYLGFMVGAESGSGVPSSCAEDSHNWAFDSGTWPATAFSLSMAYDHILGGQTCGVYHDNGTFPASATTVPPTSIAAADTYYKISMCDDGTCTNAGFLWVDDSASEVNWYLTSSWAADAYLDDADQVLHFTPLVTPTGTTNTFRYLNQDLN